MEIIFGKDMATGKFAKDSSAPLGTEDGDTEDGPENGTEDVPMSACGEGATSNARPTKKAKIVESTEDVLIGAFNKNGDKLAMAITQVAKSNSVLPDDLFDKVNNLSLLGFNDLQISMYFAHQVANPLQGNAFYNLPFDHQLHWMAMFVSDKFPPGQ
jgi:hypothetical protein